MKTKLRKFGVSQYVEIEHAEGTCAFCEAAKRVRWTSAGDVIFFENERGVVRRLEATTEGLVSCEEVTPAMARAEIAEHAPQ